MITVRSSNPVFGQLTHAPRATRGVATQGYADPYAQQQMPTVTNDRPMTVDDVVTKTGITLGVIILFAAITLFTGIAVSPVFAIGAALIGGIGGLITVLIATFGRKMDSAPVTLTYAFFEGLFVGGISFLFAGGTVGGANMGSLIGQAVLATLGVFAGMLFVYKTGAIKVTPKFTRILTAAMVGVLVLAVGNLVGAMFFGFNPLRDGGMLAIIFSLVCIGLAAMSFLVDFDQADRLIRAGAPSKAAWGVALGLAVTLVWLYTEILRLMSYFRN